MSKVKVINTENYTIKVVPSAEQKKYISSNDIEMDVRAVSAVKAALDKAKICKKPIAGYDAAAKQAYIKYPDGVKKYVK